MSIEDCPDCAAELPTDGVILECPKCGSTFRHRVQVFAKPHEFKRPIEYARAHLKAAELLLNSIA